MGKSKIDKSKVFRGDITLSYGNDSKKTKIKNEQIIYIMVEQDYMEKVLPVIFISINANNDLYNKIINKRETNYFYLKIVSKDALNKSNVRTKPIDGKFKYIPETTNADYGEVLNKKVSKDEDTSYRTINIGLVSEDQSAELRKPFNGFYRNTDSSTLIAMALQHISTTVEVQPLDNNVEYEQISIPPVSTVYRFLEFLFNHDAFYNSNFRFFMDFDKAYLLSQSGEKFTNTDNTVIIELKNVAADESIIDGVMIKNGAWHVYVNQVNTRYMTDQTTPAIVNTVAAYNDGSTNPYEYSLDNGSEGRVEFSRTNYGNTVQNQYSSDDASIEILKNNIDGYVFTPDKQYQIIGTGDYSKFNGNYLLTYKRVFFKSIDGMFLLTCNLGFKPAGDNNTAHAEKVVKAASSTAHKETSSTNANSQRGNGTKQAQNSGFTLRSAMGEY